MGNSFRCCIACMLPCGALDVVRVLHPDGRVDEYYKSITAGEVMKANPKHVLAQPICQKSSLLHPDAQLQKGKIYFLIPTYTLHKKPKPKPKFYDMSTSSKTKPEKHPQPKPAPPQPESATPPPPPLPEPRYRPSRRQIEGRRSSVWRPALESIAEVQSL